MNLFDYVLPVLPLPPKLTNIRLRAPEITDAASMFIFPVLMDFFLKFRFLSGVIFFIA